MAHKPQPFDPPPMVLAPAPKESWWVREDFHDRAHAEQCRMRSTRFGIAPIAVTAANEPKREKLPLVRPDGYTSEI
jgi:hypothetical protein